MHPSAIHTPPPRGAAPGRWRRRRKRTDKWTERDTNWNARDPPEHIPRPQSPPDGGAFSPTHTPLPDPAPHRPSRAAGRRPPSKKQYFCCLSGGQPAFWNHVLLVTGSGAIALITMLRKSPPAPRCGGGVGGEAPHPIPQLRNFGGPLYGPSTDPPPPSNVARGASHIPGFPRALAHLRARPGIVAKRRTPSPR